MEHHNNVTSDSSGIKVVVLPNLVQENISIETARDNKMKSINEIKHKI